MKQLRIYTLKDKESAEKYFRTCWPKHMVSLPKFGIFINSVYLGGNEQDNQVIAVVTFPEEGDVNLLNRQYMQSPDFSEDMRGFNMTDIIHVDEIAISETLF
ncbi:hypothetical protein [Kosakonia radicincitans]|uniref:hypothetical protein n=1 Tax=Kosakonia radicincitans TaxID=283686 RepID=UPI0031DC7447